MGCYIFCEYYLFELEIICSVISFKALDIKVGNLIFYLLFEAVCNFLRFRYMCNIGSIVKPAVAVVFHIFL